MYTHYVTQHKTGVYAHTRQYNHHTHTQYTIHTIHMEYGQGHAELKSMRLARYAERICVL